MLLLLCKVSTLEITLCQRDFKGWNQINLNSIFYFVDQKNSNYCAFQMFYLSQRELVARKISSPFFLAIMAAQLDYISRLPCFGTWLCDYGFVPWNRRVMPTTPKTWSIIIDDPHSLPVTGAQLPLLDSNNVTGAWGSSDWVPDRL